MQILPTSPYQPALMKSSAYRAFEYQLVLAPHESLRNRIRDMRQEFNQAYNMETASRGRCSILLCSFTQYDMMEERLNNRLHTIAMGATPFKIELQGFSSYPAHSILINVATRLPIQQLVKNIRQQAQRLMKINEEYKPHFILEPSMVLASRLKPWQYEKAWLDYSHKHFSARFIADSMILLRRPVGEFQYSIHARYQFENMPVATKQGLLFA